jgi:peptidoglycan/xylan/chitin deacetylase (PgdA/CDA1 family)
VDSPDSAPLARRARRRPAQPRWERFALAVGITVAVVLVFGAGPLELHGEVGARAQVAASVRTIDTEPALPPTTAARTTDAGTPLTTRPSSTVPRPTTTVPSATTAARSTLRVPGLGLPRQPEPQPVSLAPASSAPIFSRIPTTNKVIFLGIDDGMVRDPAVADLLKQANVPFSMFLVQSEADAGSAYFQQLQQYGGVVESHTITHPDLTKLAYGQVQREVCGVVDDYQQRYGRRPTLFRSPYGATNGNVQAAAASCGLKAVVLWKGSTNDGRLDLQDGTQLTPGDVILMHFRTDLLTNLQKVFQTCRDQGFAIASLEDYLAT